MADVILLVFEGDRTEPAILSSLKSSYFDGTTTTIVHAAYCTDIYRLWRDVQKEGDDLDLIELIRDKSDRNKKLLAGIKRHMVSQTFLFFDYDGHAPCASDAVIKRMLAHFDNESGRGKLYISYPMVEAIKHIKRNANFCEATFQTKIGGYKNHVSRSTDFLHVKKFNSSTWQYINLENYKKANFLVRGNRGKPTYKKTQHLTQERIFYCQEYKHIQPHGRVAVLSAFPFFIVEYFGEGVYKRL